MWENSKNFHLLDFGLGNSKKKNREIEVYNLALSKTKVSLHLLLAHGVEITINVKILLMEKHFVKTTTK